MIVTGVLGYLTGRRKTSGSVSTTDADKLWAQVDIHLKRLDGLIATQSLTISAQGARIAELAVELHLKDEKIAHLEESDRRKSEIIATLTASDTRKTAEIIDLQTELEKMRGREMRVAATLADKEEREAG